MLFVAIFLMGWIAWERLPVELTPVPPPPPEQPGDDGQEPEPQLLARAEELLATAPWGREQWQRISDGETFDGMEAWLPWLGDAEHVLYDLVGDDALVVATDPRRLRDRAVDIREEEVSLADTMRQWAPVVFVYLLFVALMTVVQMLLNNTVEEVLQFSRRGQPGRKKEDAANEPLSEVIERVTSLLHSQIRKKNHSY